MDFLFEALKGQGIWTITSVMLIVYVLKETEKREKRSLDREEKLLNIIDSFKDQFVQVNNKVDIIKVDVDDIKESIKRGANNG